MTPSIPYDRLITPRALIAFKSGGLWLYGDVRRVEDARVYVARKGRGYVFDLTDPRDARDCRLVAHADAVCWSGTP